ncbi:MAG TPA: hypothetical protein VFV73_24760 [Streptosporangiaceae bacterium]|nr:hypothetical protein [Streptosporangiaceae bacterium]
MAATTTAIGAPEQAEQPAPPPGNRRAVALAAVYYLLGALAIMLWLWRHPAGRVVAGNPNDADQLAWFFRYDATALAHGHLPALITTAMNAPQGVSVMWNTFMMLPGTLLAPVTWLAGPQAALTVFMTAGFAGSALAMFVILRRWIVSSGGVSVAAAALGGAVYGFSPAVVHSAIGHYDLQFAVLPPLMIDAGLRLATGRIGARRGGIWLGLLVSAQLFITEEILAVTAIAGAVMVAVLAASRPRAVRGAVRRVAGGLGVAAGVTLVIAGYPLYVQFFGPLRQHGSPFTADFFKNDLSTFVVPSSLQLFHTHASAAAALRFQGELPEYLGYLGWPLIVLLVLAAIACWRRLPARTAAVTCAVLGVFSLGGTLMFGGHGHPAIKLPWYWLQSLPLLNAALPDRFSLVADGAAAALLAFAVDAAIPAFAAFAARPRRPRRLGRRPGMPGLGLPGLGLPGLGLPRLASGWRPAAAVMAVAGLAALPIVPAPLPAVTANPVPSGWQAAFTALRLPSSASVLTVPVPMSTFTEPLRWQATTGQPGSLVGGYFIGPAWNGRSYIDGSGLPAAARYLNLIWACSPAALPTTLKAEVPPGVCQATNVKGVSPAKMRDQIRAWRVSAVVAVTTPGSLLAQYLTSLLGSPSATTGDTVAWRLVADS